jgi:cation:H+ antiporter
MQEEPPAQILSDHMFWTLFLLIIGFGLLIFGADFFVKGATILARRFKVAELTIGLTIVALGTSAPELVVNAIAAAKGHTNVVLGNIIGSNNFNLFIILSITALIFPVEIKRSTVVKEIPYSLIAAVAVLLLANDVLLFDRKSDTLSRPDGIILLVFFAVFLFYVSHHRRNEKLIDTIPAGSSSIPKMLVFLVAGLTGLIAGGKLIVDNAVALAHMMGISERVIGLTVVAAGTSLPELATSAVAGFRKKSDIAIGNIIGSNIFNIFLILPICIIISPVTYPKSFNVDLTLLIVGTILVLLFAYTGKKARIDRWEAVVLLGIFILYSIFLL